MGQAGRPGIRPAAFPRRVLAGDRMELRPAGLSRFVCTDAGGRHIAQDCGSVDYRSGDIGEEHKVKMTVAAFLVLGDSRKEFRFVAGEVGRQAATAEIIRNAVGQSRSGYTFLF